MCPGSECWLRSINTLTLMIVSYLMTQVVLFSVVLSCFEYFVLYFSIFVRVICILCIMLIKHQAAYSKPMPLVLCSAVTHGEDSDNFSSRMGEF